MLYLCVSIGRNRGCVLLYLFQDDLMIFKMRCVKSRPKARRVCGTHNQSCCYLSIPYFLTSLASQTLYPLNHQQGEKGSTLTLYLVFCVYAAS